MDIALPHLTEHPSIPRIYMYSMCSMPKHVQSNLRNPLNPGMILGSSEYLRYSDIIPGCPQYPGDAITLLYRVWMRFAFGVCYVCTCSNIHSLYTYVHTYNTHVHNRMYSYVGMYGMGHKKVPIFFKTTTVQWKFCVPFPCPFRSTYFRVYFCCVGKIILCT